ncbi:MAG TPA: hypothetical protein VHC49_17345 [Mycobacteriales bacterium]|nr:hypothetical protein [Mycobacteriales bacterium]
MTEPLEFAYDPQTLREVVTDPSIITARIDQLRVDIAGAPDEVGELTARADLVDLLRISGDLGSALSEAGAAVDRARIAGTPAQQHIAQLRLAHVHQWREEFSTSDAIFSLLLDHASDFGPIIEAFTHQHAGLNDFDQGRYEPAEQHFAHAHQIRERLELPEAEQSALGQRAARDRPSEGDRP